MTHRQEIVSKTCPGCAILFTTAKHAQRYCSAKCGRREYPCERCGKPFTRKVGRGGRFCSRACWYAHPDKKTLAPKPCAVCGKTFQPRRWVTSTCGRACANAARRSSSRRATCEQCAGPMRPDCDVTSRFCSRECANKAKPPPRAQHWPSGTIKPFSSGYLIIKVPGHATNMSGGAWSLHHRYVVEQQLGRHLEPHERVHHRDGKRSNNTVGPCVERAGCDCNVSPPHNLELWKVHGRKDPPGVRAADYHCPGCRCHDLSGAN